MNIDYLSDIIILLTAAIVTVPLFRYIGLGSIPGFLAAGALIGPSGMGYIQDFDEISHFSEFGVTFLLFIIGVEVKPSNLWNIKRLVLGLGSFQVVVTGCLIAAVVHFTLLLSWTVSLLIGFALALSSTAFVLQLLTERKVLTSAYGKPSVAILLMQDLAVVPLIFFVSFTAIPESTIINNIFLSLLEATVIILSIIFIARYILTPILNWLSRFGAPEIFTASALLLVLGSGKAIESIGLSMGTGAFIAGLLIADSAYRHQIIAEILPFRGLLLGLFFMSMGMSLNIDAFVANPLLLIGATIALILIKFITIWPLSRLFGVKGPASISVGLLLAQSGEFALVLFALAKTTGLIDELLFQHLLIVVLLSMLITPFLDQLAYKLFSASRHTITPVPETLTNQPVPNRNPVIIIGFGRMGHRIGYIFELMHVPYLAIDKDEALVECEQKRGKPVYFGNLKCQHVAKSANITESPCVIIAINDPQVTEQIVSSLHATYPAIPIFVRGHDLEKCLNLQQLGAQLAVSETLEASAEIAKAALLHMGVDDSNLATALETFRHHYYKKIDKNSDAIRRTPH